MEKNGRCKDYKNNNLIIEGEQINGKRIEYDNKGNYYMKAIFLMEKSGKEKLKNIKKVYLKSKNILTY